MPTVINENGNKTQELNSIYKRLEEIRLFLEKEVAFKQGIIEEQGEQIDHLNILSEEKNALIDKLEKQLQECRQTNEGTRQLINKLLNDIGNYQKDIEWYKRTYVKRSLPGTIWQKIFRK
jgi:septal ring factor EnvC (AmiA/AmiB activator)